MTGSPLAGQIAVVTGGLSGIGAGIVERLRADGANVVVADVRADPASSAHFLRCDVGSEDDVARLVSTVHQRWGAPDILVNNAGVYPLMSLLDTSYAEWRRVMAINLDSVFLLCRAFVPDMVQRGYGRVVNLATNAFHSGNIPDYTAYVASKGGVIGFTRALASEVGRCGVTVNAVAPGLVSNEAARGVPLDRQAKIIEGQAIGRLAEVDDVAHAVAFFAHPDASFYTGQTLMVDGGMTRS